MRSNMMVRQCSGCGRERSITQFVKNIGSGEMLTSEPGVVCKSCKRTALSRIQKLERAKEIRRKAGKERRSGKPILLSDERRAVESGEVYRIARAVSLAAATPPWVDRVEISKIYREARRLSDETGVEHHVDHVIPIQHPDICGLHVPWNLRVIPASENCAKGNRISLDQL